MSLNSDNNVPRARLCHVVKWDDFEGYGFNLHAEKGKSGQYIGKVDEGSPSEAAGLKQGDRIVEVNEINIANESHKQVVERIKAFPNETKLLVVDQEADDYFKTNNIVIKGSLPNVKIIKTPDKNPASFKEESPINNRSVGGSNTTNDETVEKSISSIESGSTAVAAGAAGGGATIANNNSGIEESRENGSSITDNENNDNGIAGSGNGSVNSNMSGAEQKSLNLKMSAKELRAQLAARKKFDPKKESMDFKLKFDIVQKL